MQISICAALRPKRFGISTSESLNSAQQPNPFQSTQFPFSQTHYSYATQLDESILQLPVVTRSEVRSNTKHEGLCPTPTPPHSCLLLSGLIQKTTLSPPTLNCGNCSLLQISTKLHLGCSCRWHLQPIWTLITPVLGLSPQQEYGPSKSKIIKQGFTLEQETLIG